MARAPHHPPKAPDTPNEPAETDRYKSIAELAALKLPGFPRTRQNWYAFVERNRWPYREVPARGGRQGTRREYLIPPWVEDIIQGVNFGRRVVVPVAADGSMTASELAVLREAIDEAAARATVERLMDPPSTGVPAERNPESESVVDAWLLAVVAEHFARECRSAGIDLQSETTGGIGVFAYFLAGIYSAIHSMPAGEVREKAIFARSSKAAGDWCQRLLPRAGAASTTRNRRSKPPKENTTT